MNENLLANAMRSVIPGLFLLALLLLSYAVLRDFFLIIAWAFIIAYITWQPFLAVKKRLNDRANLSAALMTGLLTTFMTLLFWILWSMLQRELVTAYQLLQQQLEQGHLTLPNDLKKIPVLGETLYKTFGSSPESIDMTQPFIDWAKHVLSELGQFAKQLSAYLFKLGFVLVTLFFCYRDGAAFLQQLQQGLLRFLGEHHQVYLHAVADTTRAVVYGIVLAAMAQGITAGIGYAVAGVKAPILLSVVTAIFALIPMGAMLVWLSIGLIMLMSGDIWSGIGLLLWGFLVVSTVDNVVRPLVISGTSHIPLLAVMFGVFGGLTAFGLIGLFLGPVILTVLLSVWQVWLKQQT